MRQLHFVFFHILLIGLVPLYVNAQVCPVNNTILGDTVICSGDTISLQNAYQQPSASYLWSTGDTTTGIEVIPTTSAYYSVFIDFDSTGGETIVNGDFESGNVGFTSNYGLGSGGTWGLLSNAGTYAVNTNPRNTHTNFAICSDHTSGTGNMMVVNGSPTANQNVWCQTVSVLPNTDYMFSTWAMSVVSSNPARLQFSINGSNVGSPFNVSAVLCNWQQFFQVWNSGANTSATICIVNQNTAGGGNDFALDDISFVPVYQCNTTDSVYVRIDSSLRIDSAIVGGTSCLTSSDSVQIFVSGDYPAFNYQWSNGDTTPGLANVPPGNYTLSVTDQLGCSQSESYSLTTYSALQLSGSTTGNSCWNDASGEIDLSVTGGQMPYSYNWSTGQSGQDPANLAGGNYRVTVTDGRGCEDSMSFTITTPSPLSVSASISDESCVGNLDGSINLTVNGASPPYDYSWSNSATTEDINGLSAGIYSVTISDDNDCDSVLTYTLSTNSFEIDIPDSFSFCEGDDVLIDAFTTGGSNYLWSTGETTAFINATSGGWIWVEASSGGCTSRDSTWVTEIPLPPVNMPQQASICPGEDVEVDLSIPGGSYLWPDGSTLPNRTFNQAGSFIASVSRDGCENTASITITALSLPQITVEFDTSIQRCVGSDIVLNAVAVDDTAILWSTGSVSSSITISDSDTIYATAYNACGSETDGPEIILFEVCGCPFQVPNVFTPNRDGTNDFFTLITDCDITNFSMRIFNRWGNSVFETNDFKYGWDGTKDGEPQPSGTYIYQLTFDLDTPKWEGTEFRTGVISIVR